MRLYVCLICALTREKSVKTPILFVCVCVRVHVCVYECVSIDFEVHCVMTIIWANLLHISPPLWVWYKAERDWNVGPIKSHFISRKKLRF